MPGTIENLDYWRLTVADRLILMQDILEGVVARIAAPPVPAPQIAMLNQRLYDIESGAVSCIPWEEVRGRFLEGS